MARCSSLHILGSCFHVPIIPLLIAKFKSSGRQIVDPHTPQTVSNSVCLPRSDSDIHPMMLGKTKAEQLNSCDCLGRQVWTIFLYSDSNSEGIKTAYEAMQLSKNSQFSTKGVIHIILSNKDKRGNKRSKYLDHALLNHSPVIRVNALEPEAVAYCMSVAAIHRNTLQKDIFVDLENSKVDDSIQLAVADTLNTIELKKPVMKQLSDKLIEEKLVSRDEVNRTIQQYEMWYEEQYSSALESMSGFSSWISNKIRSPGKSTPDQGETEVISGVDEGRFDWMLKHLVEHTRVVNIARDVAREISSRLYMAQMGQISWMAAELIAFAHLLHSDIEVRLSARCPSNTDKFSRRHYIIYDIQNSSTQIPLDEMFSARFHFVESLLSQPSVLGYEVGASQRTGKSLTVWETKGYSLSNIQHILDEFVSTSGQWFNKSNLLIVIPQTQEGFEGCVYPNRCERVLDLCWESKHGRTIETNLNVVNVTTPANYFHLILKQAHSLVPTIAFLPGDMDTVLSPKEDFIDDTRFESYITDNNCRESNEEVAKVLLCSGSLYHSVVQARDRRGLAHLVAIPRLEQLVPFPSEALAKDIASYRHASIHFLQEEHIEKGWWRYVGPRLKKALTNIKFDIHFIGPPASIHSPRQLNDYRTNIINQALDIY